MRYFKKHPPETLLMAGYLLQKNAAKLVPILLENSKSLCRKNRGMLELNHVHSRYGCQYITGKRLFYYLVVCLLVLCNGSRAQGEPIRSIAAPFTESAAMRLLYGSRDSKAEFNLSHLKIPTHMRGIYSSCNPAPWQTFHYMEDGKQKRLLITGTSEKPEATSSYTDKSHADGELIGAALFRKDGNRYVLEASNLFLAFMGSWGDAFDRMNGYDPECKPKLLAAGPLHHALVLYEGTTGQGFTDLMQMYIVPVGNKLTFLLLQFHQDDIGMHDPQQTKADTIVSFRPGSNPDYYDIIAAEHGYYTEGRQRINIKYSQTFTIKNGHYIRTKTTGKPSPYEEVPFSTSL